MTKEKIAEVLSDYNHRGFADWEENRIVETPEELNAASCAVGEGEAILLLTEAYALAKEYMKKERRDDLIERYLRERKKVIHQTDGAYLRVLPEGSSRRSKTYVIQEKQGDDMVPIKTGLSFQEAFEAVTDGIGMFFHFSFDDRGLLISEFED